MPNLSATLAIKLLDGVSGPAKGAAAGLAQINKATEALGKLKGFKEQTARLEEMISAHKRAKDGIKGLASQLIAADAPTAKLKAAYERATAAADKLGNKIEWQKTRVRAASDAISAMGASVNNLSGAEAALRANIDKTSAAMKRQEAAAARSARRREALGIIGAGAGIKAAQTGRNIGEKAIVSAAQFDIGVRRQRAYAGISKEEQDKLLIPQAKRIGQDTQFSNLDIVEAQTAIMQRLPEQLPRAAVAQAITEEVKNYALSMRADMKTSAEGITAFLMQTGKDISTQDKAVAEARRASNMLVRMAKIGGMSDEDVSQFMKYAATSSTLAGLSNETLGALGVGLKRAGFRGDEAGVGVRSISSKLVSPGRKGLDALTAMGVDYNKFTKMPGGLSPEALESMQKRRFGKTFSSGQRERLSEVMSDSEVVGNKDAFIAQVSEIIAESFGKTKKGETKAQDAQKIAKLATDFHQLGVASVDSEGLLAAILSAAPTIAQLNALFTDKQGGKAGALGKAFEQIGKDRDTLKSTPEDYGKKIADEIMGGLGGSFERLKGSVETFYQSLGEANSKLLTFSFDKVGNLIDGASNASEGLRKVGTYAAVAAAGFGVFKSAGMVASLVQAVTGGGSAAALSGSAVALDGAAAALSSAAIKLGASGVAGPAGAAGGAAGTAARVGVMGWLARLGVAGGAIGAGYIATQPIRDANEKRFQGIAPGEAHNQGQMKRRSSNEAIRQQFLEQRKTFEGLPETGASAGTDAGEKAGEGVAAGLRGSAGKVEAEAQGILDRIKALFSTGIDVPMRIQGNPGAAAAGAAAGAAAKATSGEKVSSIRGGNVNVVVHATGDANEIARQVSAKVAESAKASMRGAFTDNA